MIPDVSGNLRTILSELNMSQIDFAKSVGTTFVYINMVVNGKRNSISRPLALLIEEKYGYSAEWILYGEGDKKIYPFNNRKKYGEMKSHINKLSSDEMGYLLQFIKSLEETEKARQEKRNLKKQRRTFIQ